MNPTNRPWTAEELAAVRAAYGRVPRAVTADRLRRTVWAVRHKERAMGLVRYRHGTPAERARMVAELRAGASASEVARRLGRNTVTVSRQRDRAGIAALGPGAAWRTRARRPANRPRPADALALAALADGPLVLAEVARRCAPAAARAVQARLFRLRAQGQAFAEGPRHRPRWVSLAWWVARNGGLVRSAALRIARLNPWCEVEDLTGEVLVAVARCARTMRPRGTKFSTYAIRSAELLAREWAAGQRARGVKLPKHALFDRRAFTRHVGSLDAPDDGFSTPFASAIPDREPNYPDIPDDFWARATAALPPREARCVIGRFRDGLTYTALGAELNLSRGRIEQLVRRGEALIRETGALADYAGGAA